MNRTFVRCVCGAVLGACLCASIAEHQSRFPPAKPLGQLMGVAFSPNTSTSVVASGAGYTFAMPDSILGVDRVGVERRVALYEQHAIPPTPARGWVARYEDRSTEPLIAIIVEHKSAPAAVPAPTDKA